LTATAAARVVATAAVATAVVATAVAAVLRPFHALVPVGWGSRMVLAVASTLFPTASYRHLLPALVPSGFYSPVLGRPALVLALTLANLL